MSLSPIVIFQGEHPQAHHEPLITRQAACVLGLLVGDAAGATLEFTSRSAIPAEKVDWAMSMQGGGVHRTGPGQITDDGELALCLLQALRKFDPCSPFDPAAVTQESARMYSEWFRSKPFDIGFTCERAFRALVYDETALAAVMMREADQESQANGALMRVAPLPAWLAAQDDQDKVVLCARNDALLSHPHATSQDCNAAYCLAMWHLLRNPGDVDGAIERATVWATAHGGEDVQLWLELSKEGNDSINVIENKGHVKWAFVLTFHHLRQASSFEDGLHATLMKGGDTDTNAAIVGAMLGALHGTVPERLSKPVLAYKAGSGVPRPTFVTPSCVLKEGGMKPDGSAARANAGRWSQVAKWLS